MGPNTLRIDNGAMSMTLRFTRALMGRTPLATAILAAWIVCIWGVAQERGGARGDLTSRSQPALAKADEMSDPALGLMSGLEASGVSDQALVSTFNAVTGEPR